MERIILYPNTPELELFKKLQPMIKEQIFEAFKAGFINGNLIETKYFNEHKEELIKESFELYMKLDTEQLETLHITLD
jgi:hypothetical protein